MKKLIFVIPVFLFYQAQTQYYYKDIIAATDLERLMKTYFANNVHKVTAKGITPEGMPSDDFLETHYILNNGRTLKITTRINQVTSSLTHRFNDKGKVVSTIDSASGITSTITYSYDANGKITAIVNSIIDNDKKAEFTQTESHLYYYKDGNLDNMWRIINNSDSLQVKFVYDKDGNLIEEWNVKHGAYSDPFNYYYDADNRLTDIVRYNHKAKRLLPDFLFEYDDHDRVIQKITTTTGQKVGYFIWRYLFNEQGLKTKEALFDKEKKLLGRIDYSFN